MAIHTDLKITKKNPVSQVKKRCYTTEKIQAFKQELFSTDWRIVNEETENSTDPTKCYTLFLNTFSKVFEKIFPTNKSQDFKFKLSTKLLDYQRFNKIM